MAKLEKDVPMDENQLSSNQDGEHQTQPQGGEQEQQIPDFAGTRIEGRDKEYAREYIKTLEDTVVSLKRQADQKFNNSPPQNPRVTAPEEDDDEDFFKDPKKVMKSLIRREMEAQVAPIRKQIEDFRSQGLVNAAWQQVAREFPDFEEYRPMVENVVNSQGIQPGDVTPELLRMVYYATKGMVLDGRATAPGMPMPRNAPAPPRTHIPQHRPSSAPPPSNAPSRRPLSEEERRIMREWGMNEEEYRKLQDETYTMSDYIEEGRQNG